jgi:uridine kinase
MHMEGSMTRQALLDQLVDSIVFIKRSHPLRVAIDGIDAAGKTALANELVHPIEARARPVIRASIDGFHRPRSERYQRGADSPEGYYEDSFDYASLRGVLLSPLGPNGNLLYRRAVFDVHKDAPISCKGEKASTDTVLLFDGVFLFRPELDDLWDYRIFVNVDFDVALQRAILRDRQLFGSPEAVQVRYLQRYFPGQRLYLQKVRPQERAHVIVKNNDLAHPKLVFPSHDII